MQEGVRIAELIMENKPQFLYHGSQFKIDGPLRPILKEGGADYIHTKPAVFATERMDLAALFMFPFEEHIASIGFENDIAYICIWGTREGFGQIDNGGYVYVLPSDTFEKVGKKYEWQSFEEVMPIEVKYFNSTILGMMNCGVKVYFINNEKVFDQIRDNKKNRMPILRELVSENQKEGIHARIV